MLPTSLREQKKARTRAAIARAALELFAARGFDSVALADVAAAADVAPRTLFRYYADKEELLFGEDAVMSAALGEALAARPEGEPAAASVREATVGVVSLLQDRREEFRARQAVIDASPRLKARERAKHRDYERAVAAWLATRGEDGHRARLLARTAVTCYDEATVRWLADADPSRPGLEARLREAYADLATLLAAPA